MIANMTSSFGAFGLILGGLILLPLPIPLGVPMILGGTGIAITTSPRIRRWVRDYRERSPRLEERISRLRPTLPPRLRRPLDVSDPNTDQ